jgi:hypothetical protein
MAPARRGCPEALPSGHYVNEEAPEQVLDWFLRFFN